MRRTYVPKSRRRIAPRFPVALWMGLAALAGTPSALLAQRVLGPSTDATIIPKGMVRVTVSPTWERTHQRYADGLGRTAKGDVESLAADYNLDTLGIAQLPALAVVNTGLRSILGGTGPLPLTLGSLSARFDRTTATTPITIEYGFVRRLMVSMVIPMVKTRTEISLNPNPGATNSTVGINAPFLGGDAATTAVRAANLAVVQQLTAAATALQNLLQSCQGTGSTGPSCGPVNADRAGAQALVAAATAAATGIENVYGTSATKPGSPFVPRQNGSIQQNVKARLDNMSLSFEGFLGAQGTGWITGQPVGARPFAYGDLQTVVVDSAFGIRADSMVSVELSRPGDVEFGAKFLVFDAFNTPAAQLGTPGGLRTRLALGAAYRLGSGLRDSVDIFGSVGTGDGQPDIEGRAFLDVLFGRRFWASAVARYTVQQADEIVRRVPLAAHEPFPSTLNKALVRRDLGDIMALEISPRYVVTDNFAIGGTWRYFKKSEDTYAFVNDPASGVPAASNLALGTDISEQRAVLSLTYSNLAQYFQKRARAPMEVSFTVGRTISGVGVPRSTISGLTLRVYNQLF